MTIRRLTFAAALGALVMIGAPAAAAAATTECEPPGGLLGVSVDGCGVQVTLLGIDVSLGGDESGSGGEATDEPESPPDDPPAAEEPPLNGDSSSDSSGDSGSGSGSGGSSGSGDGGGRAGATSDPLTSASSKSADIWTPSTTSPAGEVGEGAASGTAGEASSVKPDRSAGKASERADEVAVPSSDLTGAAGPVGGSQSGASGSGQLRGPLSDIPQESHVVVLIAAGVLAAITGVSLLAWKRIMPSAS